MTETRKLAAILAADVVGFSRLAGADEDRTLARLRALRSDLIDPTIAVHHGRVVKRTGDGIRGRQFLEPILCAQCSYFGARSFLQQAAHSGRYRVVSLEVGAWLGFWH
jgi:adenylate cyclase